MRTWIYKFWGKIGGKAVLLSACLIVLFIVLLYSCPTEATVYAEESYSTVLADLHKDGRFSEANYPAKNTTPKSDDKLLDVISLGESEKNELFVYVYQPWENVISVRATAINISTKNSNDIKPLHYTLTYLNGSGVFAKYLVNDFTVKGDKLRYYAITNIFRPFDENIDDPTVSGQTISEQGNDVSKQFTFGEINGKPYVEVLEIETIKITEKYTGFCRYTDGYKLLGISGACDSHFVAFSTDREIDKLLEADVFYRQQSYSYYRNNMTNEVVENFGTAEPKTAYLKSDQHAEYDGGGLFFGGPYTWKRIQTVDEFIETETRDNTIYGGALINVSAATRLTEAGLKNIKNKKWVLRFTETTWSGQNGGSAMGAASYNGTIVEDVSILRLSFETNGIPYNMGVIDNKQSGDWKNPDNTTEIVVSEGWLLGAVKNGIKTTRDLIRLILIIAIVIFFVILIVWIISLFHGKRDKGRRA